MHNFHSTVPHFHTVAYVLSSLWKFSVLSGKFQVVLGDSSDVLQAPSLILYGEEMPALFLHCICAIYVYCCNLLMCLPNYTGVLEGSSYVLFSCASLELHIDKYLLNEFEFVDILITLC